MLQAEEAAVSKALVCLRTSDWQVGSGHSHCMRGHRRSGGEGWWPGTLMDITGDTAGEHGICKWKKDMISCLFFLGFFFFPWKVCYSTCHMELRVRVLFLGKLLSHLCSNKVPMTEVCTVG